jgi:hypothetical protein
MAISLKTTLGSHTNGVKILVYGKTSLIPTMPAPIILSAEAGLLSISGHDIPFIEINSMATLMEAYSWLTESAEAKQFQSVALDSISEIGEVVLNHEKKLTKDPRQAYGALQEQMTDMIRAFRDIPGKHVYFTAKCEKATDEQGRLLYSPSMPGSKLGQSLPYFFDEVFALRVERDNENQPVRALMTQSDGLWQAKDRSGRLSAWEQPDLGAIIRKIGGDL